MARQHIFTMSFAAEHLTAELQPRRSSTLAKAWHFVTSFAEGLLGGGIPEDAVDLVILRRETGAEVMRTPADVGPAEFLLDQVQRDLESKTVEEFFAEWRTQG